MTKRCVGCGANFQSYDINKPGFIKEDLKEKKIYVKDVLE